MYYNKKTILFLVFIALGSGCSNVDSNTNIKNNAPIVSDIFIEGTVQTAKTLTLNYIFHDEDDDSEGNSTIVWSTQSTELQRASTKTFVIPKGHVGETISAYIYPEDAHGLKSTIKYNASNNLQSIIGIEDDNNENNFSTSLPIWIIGDSTVSDYQEPSSYRGWGQLLKPMFKNADRVDNRARSGASSKSYVNSERYNPGRFWGDGETLSKPNNKKGLKQIILETNTTNGGYLLIQFGHNDRYGNGRVYSEENTTVPGIGNEFDEKLMQYVKFAKEHNITPILITPVSIMYYNRNENGGHTVSELPDDTPSLWEKMTGKEGDWPETMRKIAKREKISLLDLTKKSIEHFSAFESDEEIINVYSRGENDKTHFNEKGAKKMAQFIKELACDSDSGNTNFCKQFLE